ncbi:hypothetical protein [Hyphococcus luteus]|uniref:Uncharacterized protein n=1 Tax=Hyphococcus luteus TaxID=2058213 RepID=A0A2S7JZW0_9PROT|nr:hypothetical protein [Marinicaulis flavus]PQA85792.1 hypothetical protein CW354_19790 [Marinicaulis flavus]
MKWLLSLSIAQTALIAMLGLRVVAIDLETDAIAKNVDAARRAAEAGRLSSQTAPSWENASAPSLTAEEARLILREELAALERPAAQAEPPAAPSGPSPEETRRMAANVAGDINYYKGAGAITPTEMEILQTKIAKLPLAERRNALSELARAMTRGEIDGLM